MNLIGKIVDEVAISAGQVRIVFTDGVEFWIEADDVYATLKCGINVGVEEK